MRYFLIAGEASGDLHASHLMAAILERDPAAEFRFFGGDHMESVAAGLLRHYKTLAYMGFIPVLLHARTILRGMKQCKEAIREWRPDTVILVDYPGFNLKIARYVKQHALCPVFYYISPKIWAWKEYRIRSIRRDIDRLFSILPFEVDFFERKHHYPISYVGNPTLDEVDTFLQTKRISYDDFLQLIGADEGTRVITLLPGSRMQEIRDNLSRMLRAVRAFADEGYRIVVCAAPSIDDSVYHELTKAAQVPVRIIRERTFDILSHSTAALVTSGTATLETALLGVPQVVCYYMNMGWLMNRLRRLFLHIPYISLVNLIAGRKVVAELVGNDMTPERAESELRRIIVHRDEVLRDYAELRQRLGQPGAPARAAEEIIARLAANRKPAPTTTINTN